MKKFLHKLIGKSQEHEHLLSIVRMMMFNVDAMTGSQDETLKYQFQERFEVTKRFDKDLQKLLSE